MSRVRKPISQNEHLWCVINKHGLSASERLVAHTLHALCYVRTSGSPGECREPIRQASHEYLAMWSGLSKSTVIRATAKLVEAGLFNRLDGRKGGYGGKHVAATYRPMVPAWWEKRLSREARGITLTTNIL